ncbi:MAG: ATP-dependent Clp protease ATP-binding subunit ClpX, partial [Deltaproteobacteria bacterium]|nr:ATP-dependent Clp protease ATP-binding subunit ClpX [Deltaproteobacteria bacterium]
MSAKQNDSGLRCSFCGKKEYEVRQLIVQDNASICDQCVAVCGDIIARQKMDAIQSEGRLLAPMEIKAHLDEYV